LAAAAGGPAAVLGSKRLALPDDPSDGRHTRVRAINFTFTDTVPNSTAAIPGVVSGETSTFTAEVWADN